MPVTDALVWIAGIVCFTIVLCCLMFAVSTSTTDHYYDEDEGE